MAKPFLHLMVFSLLALAVMAARVNAAPAAAVSQVAVLQQQDETPAPGEVPVTGDDSYGELSERLTERQDEDIFSSNLLFLVICGAAFLVVVIGLLTRARFHRFPPREG